jgi:hypothetical protein
MNGGTTALSLAEEARQTALADAWMADNDHGDDPDPDLWPMPDQGRTRAEIHYDPAMLPGEDGEAGGDGDAIDAPDSLGQLGAMSTEDDNLPATRGSSVRRGGHLVRLEVPLPFGGDVVLCFCGTAPATRRRPFAKSVDVCDRCDRYARRHGGKLPTKRLTAIKARTLR